MEVGPKHLPGETLPELKEDRRGYYDYLSRVRSERLSVSVHRAPAHPPARAARQAFLSCVDRSMKSGLVRALKGRIDRIVHYVSNYKRAMAHHK